MTPTCEAELELLRRKRGTRMQLHAQVMRQVGVAMHLRNVVLPLPELPTTTVSGIVRRVGSSREVKLRRARLVSSCKVRLWNFPIIF